MILRFKYNDWKLRVGFKLLKTTSLIVRIGITIKLVINKMSIQWEQTNTT